jgi:hypothetical protein
MRRTLTLPLFTAALLPFAALAGGSITVPKKVPYEKGIHIPDAVRAECGLEQKAAELLRDALGGKFDKVNVADSVSGKTAGKALEMRITNVLAPGGGPWSGPKSVEMRGTLWENGKQLGSFTARRNTTRGGGTCGMLERDAKEIAADIAKWIESPGKGDRLGDAK